MAWSDAASTKGLGAFYLSTLQTVPDLEAAFSIAFPPCLAKAKKHINVQEMRAVEQVFLRWGRQWKGKCLVIHVDNQAVAHGLTNRTIHGAPMRVLRRCLLLASECDVDLVSRWVSTDENALADALSRFDYVRIADLAPQLLTKSPACNPLKHGFLTYSSPDCPQ